MRADTTEICSLWRGSQPLAVHALHVDRTRRSLHFSIGGRVEGISSPPPSFLLHCYRIRKAISEGYVLYDFLRGNERYKYSFCTEQRLLHDLVIQAPSNRVSADDPPLVRRARELQR